MHYGALRKKALGERQMWSQTAMSWQNSRKKRFVWSGPGMAPVHLGRPISSLFQRPVRPHQHPPLEQGFK